MMDIRLLTEEERPLAKALWKQAFGDTDAFIDWYFDNKVLPGQSLGLFDGGLASVVHMIPYTVSVQRRHLPSAFIAGAATDDARRGQGLMRTLLRESLALMRERGILLTHLYPFNHEFYERLGWGTYSHVRKQSVTAAGHHRRADVFETEDAALLSPLYGKMMRRFDGYVVRSAREWDWRLGELMTDGGKAAVLIEDNAAVAYMLYYEKDGVADVIETVYVDDEASVGGLLAWLFQKGYKRVKYNLPADRNGAKHGMARVVDVHALLNAFGAQSLLNHVSVEDTLAPWNSVKAGAAQMPVNELARLVHQGASRFESYLGGAGDLHGIFDLQTTCIFEAY
jgi:predicted acetyltransferase